MLKFSICDIIAVLSLSQCDKMLKTLTENSNKKRVYNFFGGLLFAGIDYITNSPESRLNKRRNRLVLASLRLCKWGN